MCHHGARATQATHTRRGPCSVGPGATIGVPHPTSCCHTPALHVSGSGRQNKAHASWAVYERGTGEREKVVTVFAKAEDVTFQGYGNSVLIWESWVRATVEHEPNRDQAALGLVACSSLSYRCPSRRSCQPVQALSLLWSSSATAALPAHMPVTVLSTRDKTGNGIKSLLSWQ